MNNNLLLLLLVALSALSLTNGFQTSINKNSEAPNERIGFRLTGSELNKFKHAIGLLQVCSLKQDDAKSEQKEDDWILYIGDTRHDPEYGIYLKRIIGTDMMAIKINYAMHTMEIYPNKESSNRYRIIIDGEVMPIVSSDSEEWFSYVINNRVKSITITIHHIAIYLEYTGHQIYIEIPKIICRSLFVEQKRE